MNPRYDIAARLGSFGCLEGVYVFYFLTFEGGESVGGMFLLWEKCFCMCREEDGGEMSESFVGNFVSIFNPCWSGHNGYYTFLSSESFATRVLDTCLD